MTEAISPEFPFASKYVEVKGSRMHYVEEGEGEPILLLHGNPTSSYLWRNVIPHLTGSGRCIAPDLIGFGKSDKPKLSYRFYDHADYLDGFIEKLDLENITLVLHDWGSGLGLHYARRNESNVRAIAMMEALVRPFSWAATDPEFRLGFKLMRTVGLGWVMVSVMNLFINELLPKATVRKLGPEEMAHYRAPFPTVGSRKPLRQWPCEVPFDGAPADVHATVTAYSEWLQEAELPKLLLHATPGGIINAETVQWCRANIRGLELVDIGEGIHYVQEDNPHGIGRAIAAWMEDFSRAE